MIKTFLFGTLFFIGIGSVQAQTSPALFKDLNPGKINTAVSQYMEVNGTMYFWAIANGKNYQLWKSDGTAANTVLVKDSIAVTNVANLMSLRANVNGTLYYTVGIASSGSPTSTELWKMDGSGPVLVKTLSHTAGTGGGGTPRNFIAVDDKLFFTMNGGNGLELWVSDGTPDGTVEVIDLNPGSASGIKVGGVADAPMAALNGKVYFKGNTTSGNNELFSSNGTATGTTLVKEIRPGTTLGSEPSNFQVYNNELYFSANDGTTGLWKTDGTTTEKIINSSFSTSKPFVFNNSLYFVDAASSLWKSNVNGTYEVKEAAGSLMGMANSYFITSYLNTSTMKYNYWKFDASASNPVLVSDTLGKSASPTTANDKLYNTVANTDGSFTSTLWETDGTEAGTKKLITGYLGYPFAFKGKIFFSNYDNVNGYELWSYESGASDILQQEIVDFNLFPNPSGGIVTLTSTNDLNSVELKVRDISGKEVFSQKILSDADKTFDLTNLQNGIYLLQAGNSKAQKLIIQK